MRRRRRPYRRKHHHGIFKVQVPIVTNAPEPMVLVYNIERTIQDEFPLDEDLRRRLKGRPKTFWYGYMVGTVLHLDSEAPWQEW